MRFNFVQRSVVTYGNNVNLPSKKQHSSSTLNSKSFLTPL